MWPSLQVPGTDVTISTYYLLRVVSWFTFLIVGLTMTRSRPEFHRHWWWLLYWVVLFDSIGAHLLAQLLEGPKGRYWGGPLLIAACTGIYVLACRIRAIHSWTYGRSPSAPRKCL